MSQHIRLETSHFRRTHPDDPVIKPYAQWLGANQGFYDAFRRWLKQAGYSPSALNIYSVAARLALGLLDQAYWLLEPQTDLAVVRGYIADHYPTPSTRTSYYKGLAKLAEYLALRNRQPPPQKPVNWGYYLAGLPDWLAEAIRAFITHCQRSWLPEEAHRATVSALSHLTLSLRWLAAQVPLTSAAEITPDLWFAYVDLRLGQEIKRSTLNGELGAIQQFLAYLHDEGGAVCPRMLHLKPFKRTKPLPRDVPLDQLRTLRAQIEADAQADQAGIRRMGLMDRAWFLLMLHSGLRSGEVRRLRCSQLDLKSNRLRLEQAKGLKDRLVPLSPPTVQAIEAYLAVRGPASSDHLFLFRHRPLSVTYCLQRLTTYGQRCGLKVTPHQLRHSCATLLLNAGTPVLSVQAILGHKFIDTTLGYARLYDGTVAADYYRAMAHLEPQLSLIPEARPEPTTPAHLLTLVDALRDGTLNEGQQEAVHQLRQGLLSLTAQAAETPA